MEVSVQKSAASDIPKKSRSVDLKSIYVEKSRVSARKSSAQKASKGLKRENTSPFESRGSVSVESRRKRIRREASWSSFGPIAKRQRNGLNGSRLKPYGFVSGVGKPEKKSNHSSLSGSSQIGCNDIALGPSKKKDHSSLSIGKLENSNGLGDNVVIPKRRRGISRQRKLETAINSKTAKDTSSCSGKSSAKAQISELSTDVASPSQVPNGNRKKKFNKIKENGSGRDSSVPRIKDDTNVRSRKKKGSTMVKQDHLEAPLADDDDKFYGDFQEDDEENLEQNAARMLSSRFDPSCTGFSGNRMESSSKLANGFHGNFKSSRTESSSADAAGRMLRPRKHNGKSFVRKRRHFYEVSSRDIDPYCILKQRIRVFWPLDKSWYFGMVKDYDPVTRLHYVKYHDRDEEWIDLGKERCKLLLFPSEISGKYNSGKSCLELKQKDKEGDKKAVDDRCLGNLTESEPIISWLARSRHRGKSSLTNIMKKQSRTHLLKDFEPPILVEQKGCTAVSPSTLFSELEETLPRLPLVKSRTSFNDRKLSFVYFRRRFRKRECLNKTLEQDSVLGCSAGSISILASVADSATIREKLNIFDTSVELKQVTLKLILQPLWIHAHAFGTKNFSLCRALFLLKFGKLMHVWPTIHMEIVLVDNVLGLRLLLFEGSLNWAVALLCLIITTFYQNNERNNFVEMQMPFTSIGFKLSGLRDQGGQLLFVLYSFLELKSSKWRYLEDKLKQKCLTMRELPIVDCTHSNIKNFPSKDDQLLCASVYKNAASLEGFPERSCSDIMHQIIPDKSVYLNMNPALCYIDENYGRLPPCSLSFATAPSFIMSLHLKLLIESNAASVSFQKPISGSSRDYSDNHDKLTVNGCSPVEDPSDQVSDITIENLGSSLGQGAANSGKLVVGRLKVETDVLSVSNDGDWTRSSHNFVRNEVDIVGNSIGCRDLGLNESDGTIVRIERFPSHTGSWQNAEKSCSSFPDGSSSPEKSGGGYNCCLNDNVHAQPFGRVEEQSVDKGTQAAHSASDLGWEMNEYVIHSINPTAPRSIWHHNGHSSVSPTFGHRSNLWLDDFMRNGFISGSKKPRTQVSYSLPFGGYDLGSKRRSHQRKARPYKKTKVDNAKRISGGSASAQSYHESLTCNANVLVTVGDRGWRECGAQVVLESDDQKDWRICIKFSGATKYVYKAHHVLQPGITNRYTHAMMWKGGKDWTLEFTDRSQWSLFKEMHEECYNRNIRAAYVKNIPIPGVRLIADGDDNIVEAPFVRSSSKYYRQVGTEVDMALDPSHVLYDMDSDDEDCISAMRNSVDTMGSKLSELSDDMFERVMDIFEKFAFAQQCDEFSSDEIEEFMADVGPMDIIKAIYEHWQQKRLKKGLPLIRQFQPALWECYQQQLKDWELAMSKMHSSSDGCQDKACSVKKPPMFAFCLRPRGLEIPNKGSKQRSHKKFMSTGCHNSFARELDGFHTSGRRSNGFSVGEEKDSVTIPSYDSSDSYHSNDGSERCHYPKLYRNNSKKRVIFRDSRMMPFSFNKKLKKNGSDPWGAGVYELPSMKQVQRDGLQRHRADIDEFRLRDASSAAQHASNMAKLKREKAQWLLHKADLALHKATVALMIAEAMKESEKDMLCDG